MQKTQQKQEEEQVQMTGFVFELGQKAATYSAQEANTQVDELYAGKYTADFEIGAVLSAIKSRSLFSDLGFEDFKSYLANSHGAIGERKAGYLIRNYEVARDLNIPEEDIREVDWTKFRLLCPHLDSENCKEWVKAAKGMTVIQLEAAIKEATTTPTTPTTPVAPTASPSDDLTTLSFDVHPDMVEGIQESLSKAQKDTGSDAAHALEAVCLNYATAPKPNLKTLLEFLRDETKESDLVEVVTGVLTVVGEVFSALDIKLESIERAKKN